MTHSKCSCSIINEEQKNQRKNKKESRPILFKRKRKLHKNILPALQKMCLKVNLTQVSGLSPQWLGFGPDLVMWDLWWTKWYLGRLSPSTSVSPATHLCAKFSILIITRGRLHLTIKNFNFFHRIYIEIS
jgi:hypothetical protein